MSKPVKFSLADGTASLRIAVGGGYELQLEAGKTHATADAAEIAALDNHPAAKRVAATKNRRPRQKPATPAPAPAPDEETS